MSKWTLHWKYIDDPEERDRLKQLKEIITKSKELTTPIKEYSKYLDDSSEEI